MRRTVTIDMETMQWVLDILGAPIDLSSEEGHYNIIERIARTTGFLSGIAACSRPLTPKQRQAEEDVSAVTTLQSKGPAEIGEVE